MNITQINTQMREIARIEAAIETLEDAMQIIEIANTRVELELDKIQKGLQRQLEGF